MALAAVDWRLWTSPARAVEAISVRLVARVAAGSKGRAPVPLSVSSDAAEGG